MHSQIFDTDIWMMKIRLLAISIQSFSHLELSEMPVKTLINVPFTDPQSDSKWVFTTLTIWLRICIWKTGKIIKGYDKIPASSTI